MSLSKIRILDSGLPGPNIVIMGGVHGNELCGVRAIEQCNVVPRKGKITLILANLEAIEKNVRFIENDLNRSFNLTEETKEIRIANELKPFLKEADALLDLHASSSKDSEPFAICQPQSLDVVRYLPVTKVVTNIDKFHAGSTDEYMNKQNKIGICVECGYMLDESSVEVATRAIQSFCVALGVLSRDVSPTSSQCVYRVTSQIRSIQTFVPDKEFADFEFVPKGFFLGKDGNADMYSEKDMYVIFVRKSNPGGESFLALELT